MGNWRISDLRPLATGSCEAQPRPPLNSGPGGTSLIAVSVIDFIAAISVLSGAVVAFRPELLLRLGTWLLRRPPPGRTGEPVLSPDQQSVFRMIGIMVMAFAFTFAAFSTLIFAFSRGLFR